MAPSGVVAHSRSWTRAAYEPHEVLPLRLFGLRQCDRRFKSTRSGVPCEVGRTVFSSLVRPSRKHADGFGDADACDVRMLPCLRVVCHHQKPLSSAPDEFADFLKIDPAVNITAESLGLLLNYGMGPIPSKRVQNFCGVWDTSIFSTKRRA